MSNEKPLADIAKNVNAIRQKISAACARANRNVSDVRLVGVTKTVSSEKIRAAAHAGVADFGENYAQEALPKMNELSSLSAHWHFIGALQSNKVKQIHDRFSLIHAVDRWSTLAEISKRALRPQSILLEVNLANEFAKSGVSLGELPSLLEQAQKLTNVVLRGLMFMPPLELARDEQRRYFGEARQLRDRMVTNLSAPHSLKELSMGTSHDFETAIEEGATLVRVGSAIFGERA